MGISGRLKRYFKGVSKSFIGNPRKFLWCFKGVLMEFQWTIMCFKGIQKKLKECSKGVWRHFQRSFKGSFSVSQENLKGKLQCCLAQLFQV